MDYSDNESKLSDFCFSCGTDEYDISKSINSTVEIEWVSIIYDFTEC